MKKPRLPSAVEILFCSTADGLRIDRLILKPARSADEGDLRRFADRVTHGVPGIPVILCSESGSGPRP